MKKRMFKKRKLHKEQYRAIICFGICFLLLCFAGGTLFAKYYAGQSNKGVATASSLYFCSNVLKTLTDDNYPNVYNTTAWDGNAPCEIDVQIQNYQNQLLYNDKNLDITYNITFELVGESDGGTYQVKYGTDAAKTISYGSKVSFDNITLHGGTLAMDEFHVAVERPSDQSDNGSYRSVGIKVTATPVSPSYVTSSATLGGILYASLLSAEYQLVYSFDKVTNVDDFAGFPCTISYTPGEDNSAHEIEIRWYSGLEIDQFNPYYQQAKQAGNAGEWEEGGNVIGHYMKMYIPPYATVQIAFYRTNWFESSGSLIDYVSVTDLTRQNNGGSVGE